jgi:hypothetical protein
VTGKTYTIRRWRLNLAVAAVVAHVAILALLGRWAWLINAVLIVFAVGAVSALTRPRSGSPVRQVDDGPGDAQLVADAIERASLRDMVMRDMRGQQ